MRKSKEELVKDMKKLFGITPYEGSLCMGDGYFSQALKRDIDRTHKYDWDYIYHLAIKDKFFYSDGKPKNKHHDFLSEGEMNL